MNFYNNTHPYYCGIDLHARLLYVCIIDEHGEILVHKKIQDSPEQLLSLLQLLLVISLSGSNVCIAGIGLAIFANYTILILCSAMPCT
jgi:predicted NBD/HSP70 family sugar kinase